MTPGMSRILSARTPDGRLAELICYDTPKWGRSYAVGQAGDYLYHTASARNADIVFQKISVLSAEEYRKFNICRGLK